MEWQQLVGFYHLAKLGSFTGAARATYRTQSALSQQVKALEQEFQCRLVERISPRRLRLTVAGERLLEFAELLLREFELLGEDVAQLGGRSRGRLRVAAPFTTLYHLFPEVLRGYRTQYPEVELTILDRPRQRVVELVREGAVDFGLSLISEAPRDLEVTNWKRVETMLMTPRQHPLNQQEFIGLEDLARYPLILPPKTAHHSCRLRLEQGFRRLGLDYRVVMESSNVELSSLYVEQGLGISFATVVPGLPALQRRALAFCPLKGLFESDQIAVLTRRNKRLSEHKRAFLDLLLGMDVRREA